MAKFIADPVTICNMALRHLGQSNGLTDFANDASEAADGCRIFYPQVIDEVYAAFAWPFATKFFSPALVSGPGLSNTQEWQYTYRVPADCIWVRRIMQSGFPLSISIAGFPLPTASNAGSRIETQATRIPFRTVRDDIGMLIYTDYPPVAATTTVPQLPVIEYVMQQDDNTFFPSTFAQAVAALLAFYLSPSLTQGDKFKLGTRAYSLYDRLIARAQANAANEKQADPLPDAEWVQARDGWTK